MLLNPLSSRFEGLGQTLRRFAAGLGHGGRAAAAERRWAVNGVILDSPVALGVQIERFDRLVQGRAAEILAIVNFWDPWPLCTDMTLPVLHMGRRRSDNCLQVAPGRHNQILPVA